MKRMLALCALVIVAAACSHPPSSGTVVDRRDSAAYSYWVAGITIPGSCTMVGKVEDCTPPVMIPGHEQYVPEEWSLKLDENRGDGKAKQGWRGVSHDAYNACHLQAFYPDCANR